MKFNTYLIAKGLAATALAASVGFGVNAASHREAPQIAKMPKVDATDFYVFRSYERGRKDYVTFIANYQPLQAPYGGPNYFTMDEDAVYEIHIDNDGDAKEDLSFQFRFTNTLVKNGKHIRVPVGDKKIAVPLRAVGPISAASTSNLGEHEAYSLTLKKGHRNGGKTKTLRSASGMTEFTKPLDNVGNKTIPDYAAYANSYIYDVKIPGCKQDGRVFAGQRAEAFAVNLGEIFDLVNLVPLDGDAFPGGIEQSRENDDLVGKANVTSLAIELPTKCITTDDEVVIGAWTTASVPGNGKGKGKGNMQQVSRLSNPLVNEVVIGLPDKDKFNGSKPKHDSQFAKYVTNPSLPYLLDALFRDAVGADSDIAPSNFPRQDLVTAFLTGFPGFNQPAGVVGSEMLRLNTAVEPTWRNRQHPYGVVAEDLAGFPNGRRPGDDVVDIALRVVMGALCHPVPLGAELGVDGAVEDEESDLINLGLCDPEDAPVGNAPFTDGAPISAAELQNVFPYLNTPLAGSPN
ncbi:DUF4331 domain-containing protein [Neptunicoccus cionae]|uniref:DUF4331 domain-containing protein n=1 Tax=Neptunicoccus cionae TaxID=2035344 RepID=A0A916QWA9_9RHOB|nr:DUF4331 domain-containing protein [Amylibacter cionae]GGA16896.1 hypothetical protein GCM10011498_16810 [Amylibacter cionae]